MNNPHQEVEQEGHGIRFDAAIGQALNLLRRQGAVRALKIDLASAPRETAAYATVIFSLIPGGRVTVDIAGIEPEHIDSVVISMQETIERLQRFKEDNPTSFAEVIDIRR